MSSKQKVWLITGVSSGFGQCLAERAIKEGNFVVGTLRKQAQIDEFNAKYKGKAVAIRMDVTHMAEIEEGVRRVIAEYSRIDVLVNNAGYGLFGAIEEVSGSEARDQMDTNFFGPLALTQAVLPHMRKQRSGHIVQISSVAGFRATPGLGLYNASKFALEGMSEALSQEVASLGIKVTIVEPGPFRTNWAGGSSKDARNHIADYAKTAQATAKTIHGYSGNQPGDPMKAAELIVFTINLPNPPLRLPLGQLAIDGMRAKIKLVEKDIAECEKASVKTAFAA